MQNSRRVLCGQGTDRVQDHLCEFIANTHGFDGKKEGKMRKTAATQLFHSLMVMVAMWKLCIIKWQFAICEMTLKKF